MLTGRKPRAPFPSERSLLPEVARALDLFRTGNRYEFRSGDWKFTARPVPASKQACLRCHPQTLDGKKREVGDPIGVALYAVASR